MKMTKKKKRWFRSNRAPNSKQAVYPTLDDFDSDRRQFLSSLGSLLGAGALATTLGACGSRAVHTSTDGGTTTTNDGGPQAQPDSQPPPMHNGGAPMPPSKADAQAGPEWGVDGDWNPPDARVDQMMLAGEPPMPDAQLDGFLSGGAPMPPSKLDAGCDDDSGSCPLP